MAPPKLVAPSALFVPPVPVAPPAPSVSIPLLWSASASAAWLPSGELLRPRPEEWHAESSIPTLTAHRSGARMRTDWR
jgi:hypothetical protein